MVVDPCAPHGAIFRKNIHYLYKAPCSLGLIDYANLNDDNLLDAAKMLINVTFIGKFNATKCQIVVDNLFNKTDCRSSCSFNGIFQPPLHGKYTVRKLNLYWYIL